MKNILSLVDADPNKDYDFGKHVHHTCYRDVVLRQFGTWDGLLQEGFFRETWFAYPHKLVLIDEQPVGVLCIIDKPDCLIIQEIQILPAYQGSGLGTKILKEQIALAKSRGIPIRLRVLRENRAKFLYERLGFAPVEPTDVGFIMELKPSELQTV